ncbi:MAG TPA: aminodeoxychorismate synthase component I [Galbitalea sp.]|nr:aminodeoxychorismate synthase component I [Galbitalea sp.]
MPRLVRSSIGHWVDPAAAFTTLFGDETDVVWLDSGPTATSGRSYLGRASRVVTSATHGSLVEFLRAELAADRLDAEADGFALGWVGWLGYETRFETMDVPRTRTSPYPDGAVLYLDRAIEFDHATREVALLALGEEAEWRESVARAFTELLPAPARPEALEGSLRPTWRDTDDEYLAKIRACQASIAAGDAYLLCLTTQVCVDATPDPVATYLALRASSPSHHGALLRVGELALLSSSPEQFLSVSPTGNIESRPIKGTRRRGATPDEDAALAAKLASSEKERAENLMIVDLMRNDIGRVSRIGSVEVPSLLAVESYAQVHQLVSTVRGQLESGLSPMDAVVACFPAGSMTGTPKSSATRILDSLEDAPRGIYSGAFGYFGLDGRIDLAMVIRSIIISPAGAEIGTGGGITALSVPDEELAEVKLKAAVLLRVLGAS